MNSTENVVSLFSGKPLEFSPFGIVHPDSKPVNLDAIGRLGKLAFQYAALLSLNNVPSDADIPVIRNEVRQELDTASIEDMRGEFMDRLAEMWRADGGRAAEFDTLLSTLWHAAHDWAEVNGRNYGWR